MKNNQRPVQQKKFNRKWSALLIIAILSISGYLFYNQTKPIPLTINEKGLIKMLEKGEVKRVILMKKEDYVKIQLTKKAFNLKKIGTKSQTRRRLTEKDIHYTLKIVNPQIFDLHWKEIQTKINPSLQIDYQIDDSINLLNEILSNASFFLFLFFILWMLGLGSMRGNNIFGMGKSKVVAFDKKNKITTTFKDVKGMPEAKGEVKEIIDFLKNPAKYTKLGGRMPRGILLIGPPGCGKTLLAKAIAGEASVPFFSISGSDFVEMFVGVGSSRVRNLFHQAKQNTPCIIFIDEIDAVAKKRGGPTLSTNEERDQTLNALLTEMDGFSSDTNIIVIAATNRPKVLDPAIKRPGRFDRQIVIDKPTLKGRQEIFEFYLKKIKVAPEVSAKKLAEQTPNATPAAIANIVNRGALKAAKKGKKRVQTIDINEARDETEMGLEKKDKITTEKERNIIAHHEAGHAIVSWLLEHANPLIKVSIIPRGLAALGYAQYQPKEKFIWQKKEMEDESCVSLAGRAAEEILFQDFSTGAQNDLEKVTHISYNMVILYGMSEEVGPISFPRNETDYGFAKPYSPDTEKTIDRIVKNMIKRQYQRAKDLLEKHLPQLKELAEQLKKKEVLYPKDLEKIMGKKQVGQKNMTNLKS